MINYQKKDTAFFISDRNSYLILAVIILVAGLVYFRSVFNGLIDWDDYEYITKNNLLYHFSWSNIRALYHTDRFITLPLATIALQMKFSGLDPRYFHFINLLIHCCNCFLVYFLAKKLSKNNTISLVVVAMFALHPTRVESIAWVMQRKDLLYTLFFLLSCWVYITYITQKEKKLLLILLVIFLGWLSSVSKIQAMALPAILFLFDYFLKRKLTFLSVLEKFILFIIMYSAIDIELYFVFIAILIIINNNLLRNKILSLENKYKIRQQIILIYRNYMLFKRSAGNLKKTIQICSYFIVVLILVFFSLGRIQHLYFLIDFNFAHISWWGNKNNLMASNLSFNFIDRLFMFCYSVIFYLFQFLFPFNLTAMHSYPDKVNGFLPAAYYLSGVILMILITISIILIKKYKNHRRILVFCAGFFLLTIFMVCHIIPIEGRLITADRYSYLAYFGLFFLFGNLINYLVTQKRFLKLRPLIFVFLILLLSSYSGYSFIRIGVWKNSFTFWNNVLKKQPENYYASFGLGNYYLAKKDNQKAAEYYNNALLFYKSDPMVYNNIGLAHTNLKRYKEAVKDYTELLKLTPDFSQAYNNRGNAYYYLKKYDSALIDYRTAVLKWDKNSDALLNKADLEAELNLADSASKDYLAAIETDSANALPYYKFGVFQLKQNNSANAIELFSKALLINPDYQDAKKALNLAKSLIYSGSTSGKSPANNQDADYYIQQGLAKAKSNDFEAAIDLFSKAIETDPYNSIAYKNRGNAKAAQEKYKASIEDFTKAISLNPNDAGTYLNRGNSKFKIDDNTACDDWSKAGQLGNTKATEMFRKYCK
jgi:tetratricopeptide (TPR) repeat protein